MSDTSNAKEGSAKKFKNADQYVKEPTKRPPVKQRTHSYKPDSSTKKR